MTTKKKTMLADMLCLLVAAIWGTGFIASQTAIDAHMSAALIMVLRFSVAAFVMLLVCLPRIRGLTKQELKRGLAAGVFLFGGFYAQILGQNRTTISHCAFLTATNVVMVPFLVWIMHRRRPAGRIFAVTGMTLLGVAVLSITPGSFALRFNGGDALSLLCALFFALHISALEWAARDADVMRINFVQLSAAAVLSAVVFAATDLHAAAAADLEKGLPAVLFLGLFSTCLCYFLQTLAQKYTTPAQAGVLLSTEGLFGSLFSVLLGMEVLTVNMVIGGLIILLSVILLECRPAEQ